MPGISFAANPAANLDQCANDPLPSSHLDGCNSSASQWVNGNLGASKSVYFEGDSIPYRLTFDSLSTTASHAVTIEWDTTKSSKHAIDYIDTYNQSVANANPCLGVSGCSGAPSSTRAIPADPQVTGAGVTPIAGVFSLWGGTITSITRPTSVGNTTCTNANSSGSYCYSTGTGFSGDKSAAVTINFTASVANPVLAWGGHISTRADWGLTGSAVTISGSPYHTRLIDLDGAGGNQDRSLSADAVIFPGFIHVIKNTTGGDATFGYTASPSPLANCSITTVGGTGGGPGAANCFFDNITNFQTYTINESTVPAHWAFDSVNCVVASPNGGTSSTSTTTATINMNEGEEWTCTYANHHVTSSPTIATTLSATTGAIGDTVHDSATLSGATSDAGGTVTYTVYTDSACSAGARDAGTKTVTNGIVPDSNGLQFNSAGTFYWQAVYSGDGNNNGATSACTSEVLTIAKNSPTIATTLSATTGAIGDTVHDSATLTGATSDAGGTVTYTVYTDSACTAGARDAGTKTVTNGIVPDSNGLQFNSAGTFYWQAVYSGDDNNNSATSACTSEVLVIAKNSPTIATTLSSSTANVGDTVHDSATLSGATSDAGGTVTYTVYTNNTCSAGARDAGTKTVTNGIVPDSNGLQFNSAGTFYWQAVYSGDSNNNGATSACTSETLVVTNPQVSQITPTNTTCQQFASGQSSTLTQVNYSVKSNKISQVDPGVFFYWVKVSAPGTYTINQLITTSNFSTLFAIAAGSNVFNSACNTVAGNSITQSNDLSTITVTFSSASSGPFYIGIKFSTSNVVGKTAPPSNNSTVHYQYSTTGVAGSTSGLDLVRKK